MLSREAAKEMLELTGSAAFRKDMETVAKSRHNPFLKDGKADADAYIRFVCEFNAFINHEPKPFVRMIDNDMRL